MSLQTVVTNAPFPPTGTQIVVGSGTLTGVGVPIPAGTVVTNGENGGIAGNFDIDAIVYDSATGALNLSTPVLSVRNAQQAGSLDVAFESGLYIVQKTPSSIAVTYEQ